MRIIQIGCNDGDDHVYQYFLKNKETIKEMLFFDADRESLSKCQTRYSLLGIQNAGFFHNAIVPIDGVSDIQFFQPIDSKFSPFSSTSHFFVKAHLPNEEVKESRVPTVSLSRILEVTKNYDLDWLFIDTEGMDALNLLSVDFSRFKIKNIVFEDLHTDGLHRRGPRLQALLYYLSQFGYKFSKNIEEIGNYNSMASLL